MHFAVRNADARVRKLLLQAHGRALDGFDVVVQIVDLPAARKLPADGITDDGVVVLHDVGLHRPAVLRRLLDG